MHTIKNKTGNVPCNTETCWHNQYCHGNTVGVIYFHARNAHAPHYIVNYGMSGYTVFFHIIS